MTTEQATQILAGLYDGLPTTERELAACDALNRARAYGRRWRWDDAERAIVAAYRALGAEPPAATGQDWHDGSHPLSVAIGAFRGA